jgi:F-type H+-transporting ATPase subunit a
MADALDSGHLMEHVKDAPYFHVPRFMGGEWKVPQFREAESIIELRTGVPLIDDLLEPLDLQLTKFMVLEVIAAVIIAVAFIRLANRMAEGDRPRGRLSNMLEAMLVFIRDEVARPAIGKHDASRFLPFLWTLFFFILGCNLLGMFPWMGSPTGAFATTAALAFLTYLTVIGAGMAKLGPTGYWKAQVPHMDLPIFLAIFLKPMIFAIEVLGILIKHFVLSVRLLANMMAGHLVLAVLIAFIAVAWASPVIWAVAPASLLGATALSLLELFVAFLQAYIFTFLAALFIGMAVHPH